MICLVVNYHQSMVTALIKSSKNTLKLSKLCIFAKEAVLLLTKQPAEHCLIPFKEINGWKCHTANALSCIKEAFVQCKINFVVIAVAVVVTSSIWNAILPLFKWKNAQFRYRWDPWKSRKDDASLITLCAITSLKWLGLLEWMFVALVTVSITVSNLNNYVRLKKKKGKKASDISPIMLMKPFLACNRGK